jgi:hypothetical protein
MLMMSVVAGRAHGQSSDSSAIAEQLFNQARDLAKANQWAEACPKFEASLRYDPVLGTRLNLATCYEHIGKLASAWSLYRESIELAKKAGDKRRDYAQKQAAALEPRLPKLAISAPANSPAGFVVTRDGTRIDAGALDIALYVDPGAHEITASAPGFEAFTQTVTLVEGKAETLAIPDLKTVSVPVTDPPKPPFEDHGATTAPVAASSPTRSNVATLEPVVAPSSTHKNDTMQSQGTFTKRRKISIVVASGSVISVVAGVALGTTAKGKQNDAFERCPDLATPCTQADESNALLKSAHSRALEANVAFGIAAAAVIGAGVLWFTGTPDAESSTRMSVVPNLSLGETSVVVMERFRW